MSVTEYHRPTSVGEAVDLLERHGPDLLVLAGGTVAMPLVNDGIVFPEQVMSLRGAGLDHLTVGRDEVRLGAACTLARLAALDGMPLLRDAARKTGTVAIRTVATVGGNLFTPPPGGDLAVALLALDARVAIEGRAGRRTVPLEDFWTGFMTTVLGPGELVVEIEVPAAHGQTGFVKFGRRAANTPAVVTVAARVAVENGTVADARIALGAVGPHPLRARSAEATLTGSSLDDASIAAAARAAAEEAQPETDAIATDWYRRRMTALFVERVLRGIADGDDPRAHDGRPEEGN